LKREGDFLYVVGETRDEFGGGHFNLLNGISGGTVPQPVPDAMKTLRALHQAIKRRLVCACHDCSEGGIAVALAEMCIGGRLGAVAVLPDGFDPKLLFSESQTRFIVEVTPDDHEAFEQAIAGQGLTLMRLGLVRPHDKLSIRSGSTVTAWQLSDLETAWRGETLISNQHAVGARHAVPSVVRTQSSVLSPTSLSRPQSSVRTAPRVLILHANGTNRDHDAALACELVGAQPEIVHVNQLLRGECKLLDYHMLVVPGGFSYGDDLGAGKLWALDLQGRFGQDVTRFVTEGRPVLGICNGFQALVKSGLLPGDGRAVTLTYNASAHFECRWVYLQSNPNSPCLFTQGLDAPIYCPVAHGEGRIAVADDATAASLWADGLIALTYTEADGTPASYPANPNGSADGIAGLCNAAGNVFGLMPHPENHVFPWQHPRHENAMDGLRLFRNGIRYA
jgi:phosphoribosylformylglycinamidine synthase